MQNTVQLNKDLAAIVNARIEDAQEACQDFQSLGDFDAWRRDHLVPVKSILSAHDRWASRPSVPATVESDGLNLFPTLRDRKQKRRLAPEEVALFKRVLRGVRKPLAEAVEVAEGNTFAGCHLSGEVLDVLLLAAVDSLFAVLDAEEARAQGKASTVQPSTVKADPPPVATEGNGKKVAVAS